MYCVQGQQGEVIDEIRRSVLIMVEGGDEYMDVHCTFIKNLP